MNKSEVPQPNDHPQPPAHDGRHGNGDKARPTTGDGRLSPGSDAQTGVSPSHPSSPIPPPPLFSSFILQPSSLHDALNARLDLEGVRDLCLRLGVDYDNLPGEGKRGRLRELVLLMARTGRLDELAAAAEATSVTRQQTTPASLAVARRLLSVVCLFAAVAAVAAALWPVARWPQGPALPGSAGTGGAAGGGAIIGVAVAEFAETADCRRGPAGREAAALVYETLAREIVAAGLSGRVALTRVARACDAAEAAELGARVGAGLVIWGWQPAEAEGLVAGITPVATAPVADDLAASFAALVDGPDGATLALSARAAVAARFLLGLVYAQHGEYAAAEAQYTAAMAMLMETTDDGRQTTDCTSAGVVQQRSAAESFAACGPSSVAGGQEMERALSVLLTERAKARAAQGQAEAARTDFDAAEALNPDYFRLSVARAADHYARREWDAAEAYLTRAQQQDNRLSSVAYGFGLIAYYRGDYDAAVVAFDRAIALSAAEGRDPAVYEQARELARDGGWGMGAAGVSDRISEPAAETMTTSAAAGQTLFPSPIPHPPSPTPSPSPTPPPLLVIGTRGANVRQGPGAQYPVVATRRAGAQMEVLGANASGEWYQVRVPGQGRGWVSAAHAVLRGRVELGVMGHVAGIERTTDNGRPPAADRQAAPSALPTPAWPGAASPTPTARPTGVGPRPSSTPVPLPPGVQPTRTPAPLPSPTLLPGPTVRAGS